MTNHDKPYILNDLSKNGAWGFKDDRDSEGIREKGKGKGTITANEHGRGYSSGETLGLLINLKEGSAELFRNGEKVEGAIAKGFNPDGNGANFD